MNIETAHLTGVRTFGPIFAAWCQLLLREARERRLQELYFVARDGFLLKQVTESFVATDVTAPHLSYLHLSRRATMLPTRNGTNIDSVREALSQRAGKPNLGSLLEFHGVGEAAYLPVLRRVGLDPLTSIVSAAQGLAILDRWDILDLIDAEATRQRVALSDYLVERHRVGIRPFALVDVGWRGSIQNNLAPLLASIGGLLPPVGLYLGLWREDGAVTLLPKDAAGLAGDMRRGRNLFECAPWQASLLLEAVCRDNTGTTLGFQMTDDGGEPILCDASATARQAEMESGLLAASVRDGVLEYIGSRVHAEPWLNADTTTLRRKLQHLLLRLAFFPDATEIALGARLVHTESHDRYWSNSLIATERPNPLLKPRLWLAGLASPWRAGYVRASAGLAGAVLYAAGEAILVATPPAVRANLQKSARSLAGLHRDLP